MISPKVDTIKSVISKGKGLARPYDFEIVLPTAGGNGTYRTGTKFNLSRQNVEDMNVAIRSFTLPSRQVKRGKAEDTINTIKYSLRDVWCESIGAVQMSNESANEPLLFNVVLCYKEFKTSSGENETASDRVVEGPRRSRNEQQPNSGVE